MNQKRQLSHIAALLFTCVAAACAGPGSRRPGPSGSGGEIAMAAGGASTCELDVDMALLSTKPMTRVLGRDRMTVTGEPGFQRAFITLSTSPSPQGGIIAFFDTPGQAASFRSWLEGSVRLDGRPFFGRDFVRGHECHAWEVIGQVDPAPAALADQKVVRMERFEARGQAARGQLRRHFAHVREDAKARGYTAVWMLYSEEERLASLIYFAADGSIAGRLPESSTPVFDRSGIIGAIWEPFLPGDRGRPATWPNPATMAPAYPGDGLCEPSRGESASNTSDCLALCGNAAPSAGETHASCPSDVRWDHEREAVASSKR